jgi:hypothetical protein
MPADAPLLYKPFQTDQLLQALEQLLHREVLVVPAVPVAAGAAGD